MTRDPVDVVITWVDGKEKVHADKRAKYLARIGEVNAEASAPTRFNQCGEISYCVKSILRFAPWVRTIHIVTDAQTPSIMRQFLGTPLEEKVKLVDHQEIFSGFEQFLPTFNSLAIESMLWRINGLANNFIYLNDDVFILRPVSYDDFFRDDNIVLRGRWKVLSDKKLSTHWNNFLEAIFKKNRNPVEQDFYQKIQENTARLVGWTKHCFHLLHVPLPAKKQTFVDFFQAHPDVILQNIRYPFRDTHQFLPLLLAQNLEIDHENVIFDNKLTAIYVNGACHSLAKIQRRLLSADGRKKPTFMCMQSIDLAKEPVRKLLFEWLDKRIG